MILSCDSMILSCDSMILSCDIVLHVCWQESCGGLCNSCGRADLWFVSLVSDSDSEALETHTRASSCWQEWRLKGVLPFPGLGQAAAAVSCSMNLTLKQQLTQMKGVLGGGRWASTRQVTRDWSELRVG
jgi:hypothetical protein